MELTIEKEEIRETQSHYLGSLNDLLDNAKNKCAPFLLLRYPGEEVELASNSAQGKSTFKFAPFHSGIAIEMNDVALLTLSQIHEYQPFNSGAERDTERTIFNITSQSAFESLVSKAKNSIIKDEMKKVVLSKLTALGHKIDPIASFFGLEAKYSSAFIYCFYHPECGLWIGASPEKLLEKRTGEGYHLHSLAGTRAVGESWTEKEISEQQIVTDYIVNQLQSNDVKNVEQQGPFDLEYGAIKHLKTSISFDSDAPSEDIIKYIHPTPAVCGLPLEVATDFINDHEGYERSYYTGYIGLQGHKPNEESYFVNLRCMQVTDDNCYIYTGAGIVAESDPHQEWIEVEAKAKTLISCLSIDE